RNHDSWVHAGQPVQATQKAKDLVRMAVAKASLLQPLDEVKLSINPSALVIGGGIAGMTAALELARQGFMTHLVERSNRLGGNALSLRITAQGEEVQPYLTELIRKVENEPLVKAHLNTTISQVGGFVGNFETTLLTADQPEELVKHGISLIATGAAEYHPQEYGYGRHPRIMTHLEIDEQHVGPGRG
ncbi:MAG: FAD-dependent oxidoreductase, partial [Deltaproteobacteria bacterium]|nr:FAD-dependent oxidoreductase [Deltaproteobacteria bacterium]